MTTGITSYVRKRLRHRTQRMRVFMMRLSRSIPYLCRSVALAALLATTVGAGAARAPLFRLTDAVSGVPVAGATVVFAEEGRPGPYEFTTSDAKGSFAVDEKWKGTILIIQPFYRPRELATPANAVLEAGESIPPTVSIDPNADVRVYPSSWIGRFDVERLPPLPR